MITLDTIIRGEPQSFRLTFIHADLRQPIDVQGWRLLMGVGRSQARLGDLFELSTTGDALDGPEGRMTITLTAEQTDAIAQPGVVVDFSVVPGTGKVVPVLMGHCPAANSSDYRQRVLSEYQYNNQATADTAMLQHLANRHTQLNLQFKTNMDPTYNIGVLCRFNQADPAELARMDALRQEVALKHAEVMAATGG